MDVQVGQLDDARGWRLVVRLDEVLDTHVSDSVSNATAIARVLARELGDVAMVSVGIPSGDGTELAVAHRDTDRQAVVEHIAGDAGQSDLRTTAALISVAATGSPSGVVKVPPHTGVLGGWLAAAYAAYDAAVGIEASLFVPLQRDGVLHGFLACWRDAGSEPYLPVDRDAVAAAAVKIVLLVEAHLARADQDAAQRQSTVAFATAPIGMCTFDPQGRVTAINPAACAILGRPAEEILGRPRDSFSHPDDAPTDRREMARMLAGGAGVQRTTRMVRPNGDVRWIRIAKVLVRDALDRPESFHAQFADITAQYHAEERAARFEALARSSPDFVAIADLDGTMQFLNAAGRRLVGLPDSIDIRTLTSRDFLPAGTDITSETSEIASNVRDGLWRGVATLRDWRDDSVIPVLATSFVIRDPHTGAPIARATKRRDIRDQIAATREVEHLAEQRRALLTELLQAEQAERRRLAEDLHDEPVQLLAATQLRLRILDRLVSLGDLDAVRSGLADTEEVIASAILHLRHILADLDQPPDLQDELPAALRRSAQVLFAGTDTDLEIEGSLSCLSPETAAVLHRCTREALSNARRHAHADAVTVSLLDDRTGWSVTVIDDGIGIPTNPAEQPGHLGIRAMTSRIEALGGQALIGRRPEGGTSVHLTVPRPR